MKAVADLTSDLTDNELVRYINHKDFIESRSYINQKDIIDIFALQHNSSAFADVSERACSRSTELLVIICVDRVQSMLFRGICMD